jgi:hypothetical protein
MKWMIDTCNSSPKNERSHRRTVTEARAVRCSPKTRKVHFSVRSRSRREHDGQKYPRNSNKSPQIPTDPPKVVHPRDHLSNQRKNGKKAFPDSPAHPYPSVSKMSLGSVECEILGLRTGGARLAVLGVVYKLVSHSYVPTFFSLMLIFVSLMAIFVIPG